MGEWPKTIWSAYQEGPEDELDLEVIPADLGRELYEALRRREPVDSCDHEVVNAALARYEEEVDR